MGKAKGGREVKEGDGKETVEKLGQEREEGKEGRRVEKEEEREGKDGRQGRKERGKRWWRRGKRKVGCEGEREGGEVGKGKG